MSPVFSIQGLADSTKPKLTDLWVFVSIHSVIFASLHGWNQSLPCVAVGPATAEELRVRNVPSLVPKEYSSEGIYQLITDQFPPPMRVSLVAGRNGRDELGSWLQDDGYVVQYWYVYDRVHNPVPSITGEVNGVVVLSLAALVLVWQILKQGGFTGESEPVLVVPSARIQEHAIELGAKNILVAQGASDAAVIHAVNTIT